MTDRVGRYTTTAGMTSTATRTAKSCLLRVDSAGITMRQDEGFNGGFKERILVDFFRQGSKETHFFF